VKLQRVNPGKLWPRLALVGAAVAATLIVLLVPGMLPRGGAQPGGSADPSASVTPATSAIFVPSSHPSVAPSVAASFGQTPSAIPADFTVSWTEMPWSGRVTGVSFDSELGIWMAFGSEEMWTSNDGVTWQRHTFESQDLGPGCPDAAPTWMVDATRMAGNSGRQGHGTTPATCSDS
jgi:hypothetical protein